MIDEHLERYSNLKDDKNLGDFRPICAILNMILKIFYIRLNIFLVFLYRPIILFLYYVVFNVGFVNLYFYSLMFRMSFFYDILVYSRSISDNIKHLIILRVFTILRKHQLYAKLSDVPGICEVEYLGHVILQEGVSVDPRKIPCILEWPRPTTPKALRGFLGLTGYYRKFVKSVSKDRPLLLYCYGTDCGLAARVGKRLITKGYMEVTILRRGIKAWKALNLPMEKPGEDEND